MLKRREDFKTLTFKETLFWDKKLANIGQKIIPSSYKLVSFSGYEKLA
jgi:hypothetical protein